MCVEEEKEEVWGSGRNTRIHVQVHTYLQECLGSDERLEPHGCGAHEHVVVRVEVPGVGQGCRGYGAEQEDTEHAAEAK